MVDGTRVTFGVNPAAAATALVTLGGIAWEGFFHPHSAGTIWRITLKPFLESPLTGTRELLAWPRAPRRSNRCPATTSLRLGAHLRDPRPWMPRSPRNPFRIRPAQSTSSAVDDSLRQTTFEGQAVVSTNR